MFTEFARWKYDVQGELAIYGELLVQEQGRVMESESREQVQVRVAEETSRKSVSSKMKRDTSSRKSSRMSR